MASRYLIIVLGEGPSSATNPTNGSKTGSKNGSKNGTENVTKRSHPKEDPTPQESSNVLITY